MKLRRKLLIVPPVALGVLVIVGVLRHREGPTQSGPVERATFVRATTIRSRTIVPRALGYGVVRPARTWKASAEVGGRVTSVHPRLEVGELLPAGTELLRLDPTEIELRLARLEADLRSAEAELEKLDVGAQNTAASLEVVKESLSLAERELTRLEGLQDSGAVSVSTIDAQKSAVLRERSSVVELESALRVAEADEKVLRARQDSTEAQLAEARLELDQSVFIAPFDLRVNGVHVEVSQVVAVGAVVLEAEGVDVAEVQVEIPGDQVRRLVSPLAEREALASSNLDAVWESLGLRAEVHLRGNGLHYRWPAEFARVAGFLDAKTRAISLVASVQEPYRGAAKAGRPPLTSGMFVEVEFLGQPLEGRVVIPVSALHEGRAYLADEENRLAIRRVEVEFIQGEDALISSGLEESERLILTDLSPAVPGMLLAPVMDAP